MNDNGEQWKPKRGDVIFFIKSNGGVGQTVYNGRTKIQLWEAGNCYPTKEEAGRDVERVRKEVI